MLEWINFKLSMYILFKSFKYKSVQHVNCMCIVKCLEYNVENIARK